MPNTIWIDADALPGKIRDILLKAILKKNIPARFVANKWLELPRRTHIKMKVVSHGFDKADDWIVEHCSAGDLVITSDIPLADEAIAKGTTILTPRGRELNANNIKPAVEARNRREDARNMGLLDGMGGGPAPLGQRDFQLFGNALDRWVRKQQ